MLPTPPTLNESSTLDRESLKAIMRDVIADVVQRDMLKPLVDASVSERFEFTRQQISAIDVAQRTGYERFESSASRMQDSADKFQDTARTVMENIGTLRATDIAQQQDIVEIKDNIRQITTRMESLEKRISTQENAHDNLRTDIHGSLTDTNRKSVFTVLEGLGRKIDDMGTAVNTRLDEMGKELKAHDQYIARRKAFEMWIVRVAKGLWERQLVKVLLAIGTPLLGLLFAAAADPKVADGIAKFLTLVLTGK